MRSIFLFFFRQDDGLINETRVVLPFVRGTTRGEGYPTGVEYDLKMASLNSGVKKKLPHRGIFILNYADG